MTKASMKTSFRIESFWRGMRRSGARYSPLASFLSCALISLVSVISGLGADPAGSLHPVVVTNYVVVTNMVVVTNYVTLPSPTPATNQTPTTNAQLATSSPLPNLNWVPPADSYDWIQLKSGEWLKGRFKGMQKDELDFSSEELDEQSFDWKDIRQLRTYRIVDLLLEHDQKASGPVVITPTQVIVAGEDEQVFARNELHSLTPGGSKEINYWSGSLSLGLTLRSGNTEQVEYNATAHLERRSPATRLSFDYIGNVSESGGVESANNHRVNSEFDLWLSRRFYLILPLVEYYKDPFQNLKHRTTFGLGVGYDIIDRSKLKWNVMSGPAYQKAWFESAQPGEPTDKGTGALIFGSRFEWDITRRIEWVLEYRGQYTSREVGETTHHSVSTLSFEMTKRFDLDLSLVWDRIAQPKVGSDGVEPKPNDFRLVAGLGVDF